MSTEKLYKDYQPLIKSKATYFHNATGLDREDLIAQANLVFVESVQAFDPSKALFSTYIKQSITWGLGTYIKKQVKHPHYEILENQELPYEDKLGDWLLSITHDVSMEARWVIGFLAELGEKVTKKWIFEKLRNLGWKGREIKSVFKEITAVVKEY